MQQPSIVSQQSCQILEKLCALSKALSGSIFFILNFSIWKLFLIPERAVLRGRLY